MEIKGVIYRFNTTVVHRTVGFLFHFRVKDALRRILCVAIIRTSSRVGVVRVLHASEAKAVNRVMATTKDVRPRATIKRFPSVVARSSNEVRLCLIFRSFFLCRDARRFFYQEEPTGIARTSGGCSFRVWSAGRNVLWVVSRRNS